MNKLHLIVGLYQDCRLLLFCQVGDSESTIRLKRYTYHCKQATSYRTNIKLDAVTLRTKLGLLFFQNNNKV